MYEGNICVTAMDSADKRAVLTADLIQEVFNIKNTGMRVCKSALRLQKLNMEMNILYDNLEEMRRNPESKVVRRKLRALLRRESEFAAFKRNYVRENQDRFPQLAEYIETL